MVSSDLPWAARCCTDARIAAVALAFSEFVLKIGHVTSKGQVDVDPNFLALTYHASGDDVPW